MASWFEVLCKIYGVPMKHIFSIDFILLLCLLAIEVEIAFQIPIPFHFNRWKVIEH